jgi:hypothetical protein
LQILCNNQQRGICDHTLASHMARNKILTKEEGDIIIDGNYFRLFAFTAIVTESQHLLIIIINNIVTMDYRIRTH